MYSEVKKPAIAGFYGNPKYYRDYRYLQDDTQVLKNPHKGWYWHYIDNGCARPAYREGIGEDDMTDFPGLNHLYLRIDWADIEKREGEFDWSYIDSIFEHQGKLGYRFTFRLCCFEAGDITYATPEWVREKGAKGWFCEDDAWQPDYGDPIFLEYLERFFCEFGRKYNRHPLVEFVDVGTYGTWGEGHTGHGAGGSFPTEVLIKHINLHLKYFPNKPVLVNDDMINASANENGTERQRLLDYCMGKGMGLRDDSVLCGCYAKTGYYGYDTVRTPFMFDLFCENGPVDIEIEHYHRTGEEVNKGGFPLYEALKRTHATYCGFHGYPRPWLEKNKYLTEHLANKLGYWYFVNGAEIPECVSGYPSVLKLYFENKGFCHAYNPYQLKIKLVANDGSEHTVFEDNGRNLKWRSETVTAESVKIDLSSTPAGEYILCVGLFENNTPIKLGMKNQTLRADGFYELDSISVQKG